MKKILSIALLLLLSFGSLLEVLPTKAYADNMRSNHYYEEHHAKKIQYLIDKKIVEGYGKEDYGFDRYITRAEMVKLVVVALGKSPESNALKNNPSSFKDIKVGHWANGYIEYLNQYSKNQEKTAIINGYPDGTFRPDGFISNAEALKILVPFKMVHLTKEQMKQAKWPYDWQRWAKEVDITDEELLKTVSGFNAKAIRKDVFVEIYNTFFKDEYKQETNESTLENNRKLLIRDTAHHSSKPSSPEDNRRVEPGDKPNKDTEAPGKPSITDELTEGEQAVNVTLPTDKPCEAGDKVILKAGEQTKEITLTEADIKAGKVSISLDNALKANDKVSATTKDKAGNESAASEEKTVKAKDTEEYFIREASFVEKEGKTVLKVKGKFPSPNDYSYNPRIVAYIKDGEHSDLKYYQENRGTEVGSRGFLNSETEIDVSLTPAGFEKLKDKDKVLVFLDPNGRHQEKFNKKPLEIIYEKVDEPSDGDNSAVRYRIREAKLDDEKIKIKADFPPRNGGYKHDFVIYVKEGNQTDFDSYKDKEPIIRINNPYPKEKNKYEIKLDKKELRRGRNLIIFFDPNGYKEKEFDTQGVEIRKKKDGHHDHDHHH